MIPMVFLYLRAHKKDKDLRTLVFVRSGDPTLTKYLRGCAKD